MIEEKLFTEIGISEKASQIYEILLKLGKINASKIISESKLKRATVYSVLDELVEKGLIEKDESEPVVRFRPKHPYALKEYIESRVSRIRETEEKLGTALPEFIAQYNATQEKPGVRYLEGIEGFKKVYQDILQTKKPLSIFTSAHDRVRPDMGKVIDANIKKQKESGITARALWAREEGHSRKLFDTLEDAGVEARLVDDDRLALPSQILIYGDKVAITSLKEEIVTTLIQNANIAESFSNIFDYVWDRSAEGHQKFYDALPEETSEKRESNSTASPANTSSSA